MEHATVTPLRQRLYPDDPYEGFPLEEWPPDLQGWGSDHPIFAKMVQSVRPQTIIEVGSWKGRSAIGMAREAKRLGLATEIVCVDTWLGAPEHFLKRDDDRYWSSLHMRNGFPQLFYQFLANVLHEGHSDVITPLAQTSDNAGVILRKLGVHADLVYIDAAHEYGPVLSDLENYWPLVSSGGVLFGDDYGNAEGVTRAVHAFARQHGLRFIAEPGKYAIAKGPGIAIGLEVSRSDGAAT
jgi:hypothetical protein